MEKTSNYLLLEKSEFKILEDELTTTDLIREITCNSVSQLNIHKMKLA